MSKKILITAGGTGGHIFPAIALAQQLKKKQEPVEILFVGGGLNNNRYLKAIDYSYCEVSCGPISLSKPLKTLRHAFKMIKGIKESLDIIKKFKPELIVGFGSFYTVPVLCAAVATKLPVILHEANRIPGKVNRLFGPVVEKVGIQFPDTVLKGNKEWVLLPLREGFEANFFTREEAATYFDLDPKKLTILIFGGSQGAQSINQVASQALSKVIKQYPFQIIQFTGNQEQADLLKKKYFDLGICAAVKVFEEKMNYAWQIADLVISRSGASTIAEQIEFCVPAIFIPFPKAADNHQEYNANYMAEILNASIVLPERILTEQLLAEEVQSLLANDGKLLKAKRQLLQEYKSKISTKDLCSLVCNHLEIN